MFTFTAHGNFPIIIASMKNPENSSACFVKAFACSIVFQVSFALVGYIAYGVSVNQAVNKSVQSYTLRTILSFSIIGDKLLTYPVVYIPLESNIAKMANVETRSVRPFVSAFLIALAALLVDDFARIMSLIGNATCSLDAFVFPIVFAVTLCTTARRWEFLLFGVSVAIGLTALIGGSIADIDKMM